MWGRIWKQLLEDATPHDQEKKPRLCFWLFFMTPLLYLHFVVLSLFIIVIVETYIDKFVLFSLEGLMIKVSLTMIIFSII